MNFGEALVFMKQGKRIARMRNDWENKNKFLYYVPPSSFIINRPPLSNMLGMGMPFAYEAHIDCCEQNSVSHAWTPTNEELLADDWIDLT